MYKCTVSGSAVLNDGTRIPYREYVGLDGHRPHPYWERVRSARYRVDDGCCVFCRAKLEYNNFQTHHLTYENLGHERLRDVVTVCPGCHEGFHKTWKHGEYYKEQDDDHWVTYSLPETARICANHIHDDYWFGGDLDCCDIDVCRSLVDEITAPAAVNPEDIQLCIRNKRYEVLINAEKNGLITLNKTVDAAGEAFLDDRFGKKGGKGGNKYRSKARAFMIRHESESFNRNYWCLWHINKLMQEVKKYE